MHAYTIQLGVSACKACSKTRGSGSMPPQENFYKFSYKKIAFWKQFYSVKNNNCSVNSLIKQQKLQTGEKIHDSLEPAAIQECLQESVSLSGYFLPAFFMYLCVSYFIVVDLIHLLLYIRTFLNNCVYSGKLIATTYIQDLYQSRHYHGHNTQQTQSKKIKHPKIYEEIPTLTKNKLKSVQIGTARWVFSDYRRNNYYVVQYH